MLIHMSDAKHPEVNEEELKFYGYEKCDDYCRNYCHDYYGYKYCNKCALYKEYHMKQVIDDVMSVFDDFMCGDVDEEGKNTFLEMLKDRLERR